jgi:hypothetical protein
MPDAKLHRVEYKGTQDETAKTERLRSGGDRLGQKVI